MKFLQKIQAIAFILFLFFLSNSNAQNSNNHNVGYMGKQFLFNVSTNINILPYSESHVPYNKNGLFTGVYAALNLEGEYVINRRFGITLGTMRSRFGISSVDDNEMPNTDIQKVKVRTIGFGIKNYLHREGGLAPVGFYQHLRYQRVFGNRQGFALQNDEYVESSEKVSFPEDIISYGVGQSFGFGGSILFFAGAEFMMPLETFWGYNSPIGDGLINLMFSAKVGVVIPLF